MPKDLILTKYSALKQQEYVKGKMWPAYEKTALHDCVLDVTAGTRLHQIDIYRVAQ